MNALRLLSFMFPIFGAGLALASSGCTTDAFCFNDCGTTSSEASSTGSTGGAGGGITISTGTTGGNCFPNCSTTSSTMCTPTNGGVEKCDGIDNDCNGKIDDVNPTDPHTCGACPQSINCFETLLNNDPSTITCTAGVCKGTCAADYYDLDGDGNCEYYCVKVADDDVTCDNRDDDCNGKIDDGVDVCTDSNNCGSCGRSCTVLHGTGTCVHTGTASCDDSNTQCQIASCDCTGPGNCYWDLDGSYQTGCEYQCDKTSPYEICGDGIDNDCNGKIDGADDTSQDPQIGVPCFGGTMGICADPAHAGVTKCIGDAVVCVGPNVLHPGDVPETCNGLDDDCDGTVDNNPSDVGGSCGVSSNFPCTLGTILCVAGAPKCVGAVNPGTETCNGIDDDCDGTIDDHLPASETGACNVPIPPPAGATSPCKAGVKKCTGGSLTCVGSVVPVTGATDTCGVDANCNGILENQPNTQTDVHNCGSCGNDCLVGAVHANWSCQAGACHFDGCQTNYWDLTGDQKCTYPCVFVSAQESCNGQDDNCNGQIDEGVIAPSPVQVCGVSPSATAPECKAGAGGVTVSCVAGAWQCTFPTGICSGSTPCSGANCCNVPEVCEDQYAYTAPPAPGNIPKPTGGKDNNCNGLINENVANWATACASDDGKPPPGDGQCKTPGFTYCSSPTTTACSAKKDLTKATAEVCDGIDNDCDGLVDESKSQEPNPATSSYVSPKVVKIGASLWIMQYEASRMNAVTSALGNSPGTGNGYFCNTAPCPGGAPPAPAGVPLNKTVACSVANKVPWFNVTPAEAEQTCTDRGGHVCATNEWQTACQIGAPTCLWGYSPHSAAAGCTLPGTSSKFCNLDAYTGVPAFGDANELLVTGSPTLQGCFANWGAAGNIFDITGNLREITKEAADQYPLMGGSFDTQDENGAQCGFTFYQVDHTFQLYDTGFRCCFATDPT